ncbi:MAG: holo-ACP synthase [Proteobacteria bacterium]|nr:holo-ACP synthase [Pseudomonadota bacterium]
MIYGIGTDIVAVARMAELYRRHGERALEKLLAPSEREACRKAIMPARFLAKRFAAKEAFGKALGTGVRAPALLPAIAVAHDALGKPVFEFAPTLDGHLSERGLTAHLSMSDEQDHAIAFVILEQA